MPTTITTIQDLKPVKQELAQFDVSTIRKTYPTFTRHIDLKNTLVATNQEFEVAKKQILSRVRPIAETPKERSVRRSKQLITDYVLCNTFSQFATFTFATERYDIQKCKDRMIDWLKSQQKIHGKFNYLIVPEYHKDHALHFHALLNNYKGSITKLPFKIKGRDHYKIDSYRKGISNLQFIDDNTAVAFYVKKYITKDMPHIPNKRRFWVSKDLIKPTVEYNLPIPKEDSEVLYRNAYCTVFDSSTTPD